MKNYGVCRKRGVNIKIYDSCSPADTMDIGIKLASTLIGGEIIAYKGDLGLGKTCFTKGLAKGLGYCGEVTSPTFALMNEYRGGRLDLFHFDMYRVSSWGDLYSSGYFDYLDEGGVVALEWSENIEGALTGKVITVSFERTGEFSRRITIDGGESD